MLTASTVLINENDEMEQKNTNLDDRPTLST